MNFKHIKPLCILLTLTILIGLVPIFHSATAQARPRVFIDPAVNEFFTDTTALDTEFTVSVMAADWVAPGVYGYQFIFAFDTSMLDAVSAAIPTGHWFTPVDPTKVFTVDAGTINEAAGTVSFALSLLAPEAAKTGGGVIATVKLKITAAPPAGQKLESLIQLPTTGLIMVDPTTGQGYPAAAFDNVPATYVYSTPPPPWYLKIDPSLVTATSVGEEVSIDVKFNDVLAEGKIVGIQFRVLYPDILTTDASMVTEGAFFDSFGNGFFQAYVEPDDEGHLSVLAINFMVPNDQGTWTTFPEGSGTLATIKFTVASLPETVTTFPLVFSDVMMLDADGNVAPYRRLENSAIMAPLKPEDLNRDGNVDILDMFQWAMAFGSTPTSPNWREEADVNRDGRVNILDGVMIAMMFGFKA